MNRILVFTFLALFVIHSKAATGSRGSGPPSIASQMQSKGMGGGGGGSSRRYQDPRKAPPMDPSRRINEQDCSKPIDLTAGNLKCK